MWPTQLILPTRVNEQCAFGVRAKRYNEISVSERWEGKANSGRKAICKPFTRRKPPAETIATAHILSHVPIHDFCSLLPSAMAGLCVGLSCAYARIHQLGLQTKITTERLIE